MHELFQTPLAARNHRRVDMIRHHHKSHHIYPVAIEMTERLRHDCAASRSPKRAQSATFIQRPLHITETKFAIFLFHLCRPRLGMPGQPNVAASLQPRSHLRRNRIGQMKRDEIQRTLLFPMRKPISSHPRHSKRIEELEFHCCRVAESDAKRKLGATHRSGAFIAPYATKWHRKPPQTRWYPPTKQRRNCVPPRGSTFGADGAIKAPLRYGDVSPPVANYNDE